MMSTSSVTLPVIFEQDILELSWLNRSWNKSLFDFTFFFDSILKIWHWGSEQGASGHRSIFLTITNTCLYWSGLFLPALYKANSICGQRQFGNTFILYMAAAVIRTTYGSKHSLFSFLM
jgi:hypothetical protein